MTNISTCVGLYNNLDYTKSFYKTFRAIYPVEELVFVSYGSTDGTHEWLQDLIFQDKNVIGFFDKDKKTFSDTYNKCVELATKDFVCFAHNDMVVAPNFLENLEKYAHKDRVISYTTIEPPIFAGHSRPGKIIQDFGSDLETFKYDKFLEFASLEQRVKENFTEDGISFFMCLSREVFLEMGGFDNIFNPYYSEDDDLIRRLKLKGLECFNSLDSIVYHFVSKTSRFSEEAKLNTQRIEQNSNRTYIRKWGSMNSNNRYNIGFVVNNCTEQLLEVLEPWCDRIYINDKYSELATEYVYQEQPNTSFNLISKIKNNDELDNDIIVSFDASKLNQNNFEIIRNLQDILGNTVEGEKYEIDIFSIKVNSLNNTIKDLVIKK